MPPERRRRWGCRSCGRKAWAPAYKVVTENERAGLCWRCWVSMPKEEMKGGTYG